MRFYAELHEYLQRASNQKENRVKVGLAASELRYKYVTWATASRQQLGPRVSIHDFVP